MSHCVLSPFHLFFSTATWLTLHALFLNNMHERIIFSPLSSHDILYRISEIDLLSIKIKERRGKMKLVHFPHHPDVHMFQPKGSEWVAKKISELPCLAWACLCLTSWGEKDEHFSHIFSPWHRTSVGHQNWKGRTFRKNKHMGEFYVEESFA